MNNSLAEKQPCSVCRVDYPVQDMNVVDDKHVCKGCNKPKPMKELNVTPI